MTKLGTRLALHRAALLASTVCLVLAAPPFATDAQAQLRVGVTSATDGDPLGRPPNANERILRIGIDVQANEVVSTRANDRAHLVFLDGTSLTVGPNAAVTIDRFVYDPNSKTGDLAMTASRGVFRLVGGKISKSAPITVTTPSSTIGIRGGITIFQVTATQTISDFIFGASMSVTGNGVTQIATRAGSQIISNLGRPPAPPALAALGSFNNALNQLEGKSGSGQGGQGSKAEDGAKGFGTTNSAQGPGVPGAPPITTTAAIQQLTANSVANATDQANDTQAPPASPAPTTTTIITQGRYMADPTFTSFDPKTRKAPHNPVNNQVLQPTGTLTDGKATITSGDGTKQFVVDWKPGQGIFPVANGFGFVSPDGTSFFAYVLIDPSTGKQQAIFGGMPTAKSAFPTTGAATYTVFNGRDPAALPFTPGPNPTLEQAATVGKLYTIWSKNLAATPTPGVSPNQGAQAFQVSLSISGTGVSQRSYIGGFLGNFTTDYNTDTIMNSGNFTGSYRQNGTAAIGRLYSSQVTAETANGNAIYGPNADYMVFVPDSAKNVVGEGGPQTIRTDKAAVDQPYTTANGIPYVPVTAATKDPDAPNLGPRTSKTTNGFVGGIVESRDESGTFSTRLLNGGNSDARDLSITTDASTNRAQGTIRVRNFDGGGRTAVFEMGSTKGSSFSDSAFIDDNVYGMRDHKGASRHSRVTDGESTTQIKSNTILVSSNAAPLKDGVLPGNVKPCECAFMSWGWWAGDVDYYQPGYRQGERDRLHLSTYVSGTLTKATQLPNTGEATYKGHMVGNVVDGNKNYVGAGNFSLGFNFGSRSGAFNGNFDGKGLTGNVNAPSGGPQFSGGLNGPAGYTGSLNGAFFSGPSSPVQGVGGNFNVLGPNYKAGGTFAGQKQ
jgi:hypothetical protein